MIPSGLGLGHRGVYVNLSIVDEWAVVKTNPLQDRVSIHSSQTSQHHCGVSDSISGVKHSEINHLHAIISFTAFQPTQWNLHNG